MPPEQVDLGAAGFGLGGGEHTFRLLKQSLGWTAPQVREPTAADHWTRLILAAHTQPRLARPLAQDLRRP